VQAARAAGIPFRAVVADSLYGEHRAFTRTLWQAEIPLVLAIKPAQVVWTPPTEPGSPWEAADRLRWANANDAAHPGAWTPVVRRFHDGHEETWWAVDLELGGSYGLECSYRLVVATSDPQMRPKASTWYLISTLPLPGTRRAIEHPALPAADLAEVVRLYGLRMWVEQGYKQVKQELGWADFQVRSDRAIRRHWALVCCAFSFCWWAEGHPHARNRTDDAAPLASGETHSLPLPEELGAGEKWGPPAVGARDLVGRAHQLLALTVQSAVQSAVLAPRPAAGAGLA
jgi:hypothetical protein